MKISDVENVIKNARFDAFERGVIHRALGLAEKRLAGQTLTGLDHALWRLALEILAQKHEQIAPRARARATLSSAQAFEGTL